MDSKMNKTVVITGATSGIGLAVADGLARQGAYVIGVGRAPERCKKTQTLLQAFHPGGEQAVVLMADLSIQAEVRALAQAIHNQLTRWGKPSLDVLINNAGTVPFWQVFTPEGFDTQWAVNHLAPFLLTNELMPLLKSAPAARIITVSSGSHYNARLNWDDIQLCKCYNALRAYRQTKLANVLFTAELNRKLAGSNIRAFAADPGLVNTEIGLKSNSFIARFIWDIRRRGGITAEESGRGILYLATEPGIQNSNEIYWKHGKPKSPNPFALDPESGKRLWDISTQMCGIEVR